VSEGQDKDRFITLAGHELENMVNRFSEEFCLSDPEIIGLLTCYASLISIQSMGYLLDVNEEEDEEDEED
jgi:hypothetical protein|tara:strand:+ start:1048 stop:1257 length:210 start_codon:yes stop_codon:yes gene_type:complete